MPSCSLGSCVASTKKGRIERIGLAAGGDFVLLHRLQERGLGLRRRAVDLVGEQYVGEDRARMKLKLLPVAVSSAGYVPVMSDGIRSV